MPMAAMRAELPRGRLVGVAAAADGQAGQRHADGHEQHEPAGEAGAGLAGLGVLAALQVGDPVLDQGGEPALEVGAADLVGDEQRLAGGVGGGVGQAGLEHGDGAGEVGGDQPLAAGRRRRPGASPRAPRARPRTGPGGSSGPSDPVRRAISSIMRGQALGRPRPALLAPGPVGRQPGRWRRSRRRPAPGRTPPNRAKARPAPTTKSTAMTARNSAGRRRRARPGPATARPWRRRRRCGPDAAGADARARASRRRARCRAGTRRRRRRGRRRAAAPGHRRRRAGVRSGPRLALALRVAAGAVGWHGPHGAHPLAAAVEQLAHVVAGLLERPARPDRQVAGPRQRLVRPGPAEQLGDGELDGVAARSAAPRRRRPRSPATGRRPGCSGRRCRPPRSPAS